MVKTKQVACELTDDEIKSLKSATGKDEIKNALQDAVEYRIQHPKEM